MKGLCANAIQAGGPLIKSLNPEFEKYGYDHQKAKSLMVKAGYPEGEGFPTLMFSTTPASLPVYQEIQKDLSAIGIKTDFTVESQLQSSAYSNFRNTGFTLYTAWDNPMDQLLPYNSKYYLHIDNSVFDSLYALAEKEPMEERRKVLFKQMEELILGKPPAVFLFWFKSFYLANKRVMNLKPERFGVWEGTWIKK